MSDIICTKDDFPYNWEHPHDYGGGSQSIVRELCRSIQDVIDSAKRIGYDIYGTVNVISDRRAEGNISLQRDAFLQNKPLNIDIKLKMSEF